MTTGHDSTSSGLLRRVQNRDPEAWRMLVDLYGPLVYQWCHRFGLQAVDAADVTQEVFGAVSLHVGGFRRERPGDSFRGWLWTIARRKTLDCLRRREGQAQARGGTDAQRQLAEIPEQPPDATTSPPDRAMSSSLCRRAIELVRARVEPRTWEAFWQSTIDDRPAAEVAEELGLSLQAVYDAKYRVRRKLRQELADLLDEFGQ